MSRAEGTEEEAVEKMKAVTTASEPLWLAS